MDEIRRSPRLVNPIWARRSRLAAACLALALGCTPRQPAPPPPPPPPPQPRAETLPARDYLRGNAAEEPGYGLYAYVLLPQPPANAHEADKQRALYMAFRQALPSTWESKDAGVSGSDVAVTYWLLDDDVSAAEAVRRDKAADARFFVTHYDHARAQIIMARLQHLGEAGPLVVAAVHPLDGAPCDANAPVLVLNFGGLRTQDYPAAMRWYQSRVTQAPDTWHNNFDLENIRLSIRSAVGQYAESALSLAKLLGAG